MRRIKFKQKPYRRLAGGPENRINLLRHIITALVKFERIEITYTKAHETQKYAERLIRVAKRGDKDPEAMKIADFWLLDKKQVHKLFKVLGPRFEGKSQDFTRLLRVPGFHEDVGKKLAFLEYVGNPYPPLRSVKKRNPNWILNILVQGAVDDIKKSKQFERIGHLDVKHLSTASQIHEDVVELENEMDKMSLKSATEGSVDAASACEQSGSSIIDDGTPV